MHYKNKEDQVKNKAPLLKKLQKEIDKVNQESKFAFSTTYASINLPLDKRIIKSCLELAKKYEGYKVLVIGIGGSNLGTVAIYEAMRGKYEHKLLFADTVDTNNIQDIKSQLKGKVVVNLISKSGTTTEQISNFLTLRTNQPVVITTDRGSPLWKYGQKKKFDLLDIPKFVGGRFSVFSPVGLFPLAVAGIDVKKLLKGAADMRKECLKKHNIAADSAATLFYHNSKKINIAETFVFVPEWESLGKWYRQLMGESIGKQHNKEGKVVWNGMTPTVAVGSTDLHSMAQLYLGGPKDKFVHFLVPKYSNSLKVAHSDMPINEVVQGKKLTKIMDSIIYGIQKAFLNQKRPYNQVKLKPRNEYDIGQWLQFKMFEIIYLAYLMNVNPFDQPNVEEYKIITKKVLK